MAHGLAIYPIKCYIATASDQPASHPLPYLSPHIYYGQRIYCTTIIISLSAEKKMQMKGIYLFVQFFHFCTLIRDSFFSRKNSIVYSFATVKL